METIELQRRFDLTLEEIEDLRDKHGGHFEAVTYRRNKFWDQVYEDLGYDAALRLGREQMDEPDRQHNIVVNEGLAYILGVALTSTTDITTWYLSLNNHAADTPANTNTASQIGTTTGATITEISTTDVTETIRRTWTPGSVTGTTTASIDNSASVATYTCDTPGFTAYGAFLVGGGTSAFGNSAGTLYAWSLFGSSKTLASTDTIDVTYTFTATDA